MNASHTVRSYVETVRDREITFLAASFAYHAFVAVVPVLTLALVVSSLLNASLTDPILRRIAAVSPEMATLLRNAVAQSAGRVGASVIGLLVLLWSVARFFRGLDRAFNRIYDSDESDGLFEDAKDALIVVATLALGTALMSAAAALARGIVLSALPFPRILGGLGLFVGLVLLLLPVYYVMPPVPVAIRHALPGVVLTAIGLVVLQTVFVFYTSNAGRYGVYGVLGGILLFVTWLYAAGVVLLAGATLNVVLERASRDSTLYPPR